MTYYVPQPWQQDSIGRQPVQLANRWGDFQI